MKCMFGHKKEWVAIKDIGVNHACHDSKCCNQSFHTESAQLVRWVCKRCSVMGQERLLSGRRGHWKIHFGKLVPDHKRFANWGEDIKED